MSLVGLDIHNENESVVLLHLLHSTLSVERVNDDLVLIKTRLVGDRLARVLGRSREDQSLGLVEGSAGSDLALLVGVSLYGINRLVYNASSRFGTGN